VTVWTPRRRDTALEFCGEILDEDQSPEERAADRAERFAGYRDKRTAEATGRADSYDAGPSVHGYQSQARADRAANRHDRIAGRAVDAWSKADYWTHRTAGVISHALYKSAPGVRMGRIKTIESELRRLEANYTPRDGSRIEQSSDDGSGRKVPFVWVGQGRGGYWVEESKLEAIKARSRDWENHLRLRIAYENQMLEAQGGRAAFVEMVPGGFIGTRQIQKVNKSSVTGRVVSVALWGTTRGFTRESGYKVEETRPCLVNVETERLPADAYRPPTEEELTAFNQARKERKAAAPKVETVPLVNPTDEEAERLQVLFNERAKADHCRRHLKSYGRDYAEEFKPSTVCRIRQATYSDVSRGAYARAETRGLCRNGELEPGASNMWSAHAQEEAKKRGPKVCTIRTTGSDGSDYGARRVIILIDKPQKPLPAAVWTVAPEEPAPAPAPHVPAATVQPEFTLA
jgi:hypothetical protein